MRVSPVASLRTVTVAPGTAAPLLSWTAPVILDVLTCANRAGPAKANTTSTASNTLRFMIPLD